AIGALLYLHLSETQGLDQLARRPRVALVHADDEGRGLGARDLALAHAVEVAQQLGAMQRRIVQAGIPGNQLIVDDVAQAPASAKPGLEIVPRTLAGIVAERASADLLPGDRNRTRNARAG